jgi:hypothetical protein
LVRILLLERQIEFGRDLKRKNAVISPGVNERQEVDESVLMKQADVDAGTKNSSAVRMGGTWYARLWAIRDVHWKRGR